MEGCWPVMRKSSINTRDISTSRLSRYLVGFLLAFLLTPFSERCAAAELTRQSVPAFYLSDKLQGPTPPVKPLPPARPSLEGRQDRPAPPPIPERPRQKERPPMEKTVQIKEKDRTKTPAETKSAEQPAKRTPESEGSAATSDKKAPTKNMKKAPYAEKKDAQEQDRQFIRDWIKNTIYFLLIFAICGAILYVHHKHPPKEKKARSQIPSQPRPTPQLDAAPSFPTESFTPNIKNMSLLEQLIKYDMETYGELRSTLNYDQPAYVELLIRKYGGDDNKKINRAINLFHMRRNKQ